MKQTKLQLKIKTHGKEINQVQQHLVRHDAELAEYSRKIKQNTRDIHRLNKRLNKEVRDRIAGDKANDEFTDRQIRNLRHEKSAILTNI